MSRKRTKSASITVHRGEESWHIDLRHRPETGDQISAMVVAWMEGFWQEWLQSERDVFVDRLRIQLRHRDRRGYSIKHIVVDAPMEATA